MQHSIKSLKGEKISRICKNLSIFINVTASFYCKVMMGGMVERTSIMKNPLT